MILRDSRERARAEYDQARDEFTAFNRQVESWTEFSNKIHRTPDEQALVDQVRDS